MSVKRNSSVDSFCSLHMEKGITPSSFAPCSVKMESSVKSPIVSGMLEETEFWLFE